MESLLRVVCLACAHPNSYFLSVHTAKCRKNVGVARPSWYAWVVPYWTVRLSTRFVPVVSCA